LIFLHPFFTKKTEGEGELNFTLKNEYEKLKRMSPKAKCYDFEDASIPGNDFQINDNQP